MRDQRRYKRFKIDVLEVSGKMSLAEKVELIDISMGGVSFKADRRLSFGKEILLKLGDNDKNIDVKGIVVRSELIGTEERANRERAMVYTVGLMFNDGQSDKIAGFLKLIDKSNAKECPTTDERRQSIRFCITTPQEKILSYPTQFKMKVISLGGMFIASEQTIAIESTVPMSLAFGAGKSIEFTGRIVSCTMSDSKEQVSYEVGVEFIDLTDEHKTLIKAFIDYLAEMDVTAKVE